MIRAEPPCVREGPLGISAAIQQAAPPTMCTKNLKLNRCAPHGGRTYYGISQSAVLTLIVFLEELGLPLGLAAIQAADDALAGNDLHLALRDRELFLVAELLDADAVVRSVPFGNRVFQVSCRQAIRFDPMGPGEYGKNE